MRCYARVGPRRSVMAEGATGRRSQSPSKRTPQSGGTHLNPIRIMAHQTPIYAHDCQRYAGACSGMTTHSYLAQRWKNSLDCSVFGLLQAELLAWVQHRATKEKWRRAPRGMNQRLVRLACLEVACEGPGWTNPERARQAGMHIVEFRRYRNRYEAIWSCLNSWVADGHMQIARNERRSRVDSAG